MQWERNSGLSDLSFEFWLGGLHSGCPPTCVARPNREEGIPLYPTPVARLQLGTLLSRAVRPRAWLSQIL
jgi:hypothetical protein